MPELPEVHTIVEGLKKSVRNCIIKNVIVKDERLVAYPEKNIFIKKAKNKKIIDVQRRGKYIIICLEKNNFIIIHLRMTGKLVIKKTSKPYDKHTHIIFRLDNKNDLRFNNIRKFGRVYMINENEWDKAGSLNKLGPEPLDEDFQLQDFKKLFKNRKTNIKALLLKQDFIAGLGNIYTDESLFEAGILPDRKADTLDEQELEKLYQAIQKILKKAIKFCGTSFSDYVNIQGESGAFQDKLKVYQKTKKPCPECGSIIKKEKIAGRSSHFCPECQK